MLGHGRGSRVAAFESYSSDASADAAGHYCSQVIPTQQQQQQQLLAPTMTELIYRLGKELTCAICLGILTDPTITPCNHPFCRQCLDRMLRVGQKSEGACPICKVRLSRRNVVASEGLRALADAFEELAGEYKAVSGKAWDQFENVKCPLSASGAYSPASSTPDSAVYVELKARDAHLASELNRIDQAITSKMKLSQKTDTQALLDAIDFPSSPDDDLFCKLLPITPSENPASTTGRNIVLLTSLVKADGMKEISIFTGKFKAKQLSKFNTSVTHLVTEPNNGRVAKRTLKYLLAMLEGCWIVSQDWIKAANESPGLLLPSEEDYEVYGDECFPGEEGPRRARLSRAAKESPLLTGYSFYLYGAFSAPSLDDLALLIRESGAELITDINKLRGRKSRLFVICDPKEQADFEKDAGIIVKYMPLLSSSWLLDCISAYQIVDITPHIVLE